MKTKHNIKKFSILLPLLLCVVLIAYFLYIFNYFNESYYMSRYNDAKHTVDIIADSIESLKREHVPDQVIFDKILDEALSSLDDDQGIYLRLLNLDFENILLSSQEDKKDFDWLGEVDTNTEQMQSLRRSIEDNMVGEYVVTTPIGDLNIYWKQIPYTDPQYYLIVCVDKYTTFEQTTMIQFTIGIFFIAIITMLAVYDSVWSRIKAKNGN